MPSVKYLIELSDDDRRKLMDIVRKGSAPAKTILRANILLASDRNGKHPMTVQEIAETYHTSATTVQNVRASYAEKGLEATITRKKRETPPVAAKVTGDVEAKIIALACTQPPEGYSRWTVRLLADKVVELSILPEISYVTVQRTLKKNEFRPHLKHTWCIPPHQNADFVANMEDVLKVYSLPYNEKRPVVCMDEKPVQFLAENRKSFTSSSGVKYEDNEYIRNGTASIFLFTEPLAGWRYADAQEKRTKIDWERQIRHLVDDEYLEAAKIVLVMDNMNTHRISSLYEAFPPAEASRIADKLETHYTPKHGSWLNIAECELSVLGRQCLGSRRIPDFKSLQKEISPWAADRNAKQKGIDWQFTTEDARIKLKKLYPVLS